MVGVGHVAHHVVDVVSVDTQDFQLCLEVFPYGVDPQVVVSFPLFEEPPMRGESFCSCASRSKPELSSQVKDLAWMWLLGIQDPKNRPRKSRKSRKG